MDWLFLTHTKQSDACWVRMSELPHLIFPPFRLNLAHGRLYRDSEYVPVRLKTLAVLHYLIEHRERVVSRNELIQAIWPDRFGADVAPRQCILELRKLLGDSTRHPRFIETVGRHGYRFIGALEMESCGITALESIGRGVPEVTTQEIHDPLPSSSILTPKESIENRSPYQNLDALQALETAHENASPRIFPLHQSVPVDDATRSLPDAFVPLGRDPELRQLEDCFALVRQGRRQMLFVTGEAGIGKTALVTAWLRQLCLREKVWLGYGQCVEHYGTGEPYLVLLDALNRLCRGPDGDAVINRLRHEAPSWLAYLPGILQRQEREALWREQHIPTDMRHNQLELMSVLETLGIDWPVILLLEDLHWSDLSTIEALAVLARRPEGARLLVIATYRPLDLSVRNHALLTLKRELQVRGQCRELPLLSLDKTAVRAYVAARLPGDLANTAVTLVYQRTGGQPLFMATITEYLARHSALITADHANRLAEIAATLPEGLQQFIEIQLRHLNAIEYSVLEAASIAGVAFTTAAIATPLDLPESRVDDICDSLARRHLFIAEQGFTERADGTASVCYEFRHGLYQEVLYRLVSSNRRARLHQAIGEWLESIPGADTADMVSELAKHFEQSHDYKRATHYYHMAGEKALSRYAAREAHAYLQKALALLEKCPENTVRLNQELSIRILLGATLITIEGFGGHQLARHFERARELWRQVSNSVALLPTICGLWNYFLTRADFPQVRALAVELSDLTEQENTQELLPAHNAIGQTYLYTGDPARALIHIDAVAAHYHFEIHRYLAAQYGEDPGVVCRMYAAQVRWLLGYPNQALQQVDMGLRLARDLSQPFGIAQMLWVNLLILQGRGDLETLHSRAEILIDLCEREDIGYWLAGGHILKGWVLAKQGQPEVGIDLIHQGLDEWNATGTLLIQPYFLALLGEAYGTSGQTYKGLNAVTKALAAVERTGERWYEAELHRLRGELRLMRGNITDTAAATEDFRQALAIAERQQARMLMLRAANSLARLWGKQGRRQEGLDRLARVYEWFTEGHDTVDLRTSSMLLNEPAQDRSSAYTNEL